MTNIHLFFPCRWQFNMRYTPPTTHKTTYTTYDNRVSLTDEAVNEHSYTKKDKAAIKNKEQSSWPGESHLFLSPSRPVPVSPGPLFSRPPTLGA